MRRQILLWTFLPLLACRPEPKPEAVKITTELGPGRFDLTDTRGGLAQLSSYESVLTLAFDGSKAGQPVRWSSTYRLQVTKSPSARRLSVETSGPSGKPERTSLAEKSGVTYEWKDPKQCSALPGDLARSRFEQIDPAALLSGVLGAEEAGAETLGGVEAKRYTFDQRALGQAGMNQSTGELVLAKEGHLHRYRLATTGDTSYFGNGTQGTATWDYQLTRINQPIAIELPAACPRGPVDAPMLPGATGVERDPGVLRYQTPVPVTEAVAFYQKELAALGWKAPARDKSMDEIRARMADPAMRRALADPRLRKIMKDMGVDTLAKALERASAGKPAVENDAETHRVFEKGGQILRLLITRGDAATQVLVLISSGK